MRAYLLVTGTIFGLFAVWHLYELVDTAQHPSADPWFFGGVLAIAVVTAALSWWAFRLVRSASGSAPR